MPITGSGDASSGWDGIDDITVPAQAEPYTVTIWWWDEDWGWGSGPDEDGGLPDAPKTVYVTVPGQVARVQY